MSLPAREAKPALEKVYLGFVLLTETILTAYKFWGPGYVIRINHRLSPDGQSTVRWQASTIHRKEKDGDWYIYL